MRVKMRCLLISPVPCSLYSTDAVLTLLTKDETIYCSKSSLLSVVSCDMNARVIVIVVSQGYVHTSCKKLERVLPC